MKLFETILCSKCRGKGLCGKPCKIYSKIKGFSPKTKTHFSGDSPPEVFVGRANYPNINAGILSPEIFGNTEELSNHEIWHSKKFPISQILSNRSQLIYGKFKTSVKNLSKNNPHIEIMKEISMAYKPVSTEFFLKKAPLKKLELNSNMPLIGNPAPLEKARLEENPKIKPKVDYLISDTDNKAINSINELYNSKISVTNITKILSVGLLGRKTQRRMVPTRWSITAIDDTISKNLLKKIKYYPEINEYQLFHSYYNGNHYEILILPDKFAFEVIEIYFPGSLWNIEKEIKIAQDYEFFNGRKSYVKEVAGAYYASRLAIAEHFEKIKKQGTVLIMREERPEYYAPLGVGILRETCREALNQKPEKFTTLQGAINTAQQRLKLPISTFTNISNILKEFKKQTRLTKWF